MVMVWCWSCPVRRGTHKKCRKNQFCWSFWIAKGFLATPVCNCLICWIFCRRAQEATIHAHVVMDFAFAGQICLVMAFWERCRDAKKNRLNMVRSLLCTFSLSETISYLIYFFFAFFLWICRKHLHQITETSNCLLCSLLFLGYFRPGWFQTLGSRPLGPE